MTDADRRTWLIELAGQDHGPMRALIAATPGPIVGRPTYDLASVRRWHRDKMIIRRAARDAEAPSGCTRTTSTGTGTSTRTGPSAR